MTQKQHILLILGKDLLFLLLGVLLIVKGRFFGAVVGGLMLLWYGRDFSLRIRQLGQSADSKRDGVERPSETRRADDTPIVDDGKIQVTDLSAGDGTTHSGHGPRRRRGGRFRDAEAPREQPVGLLSVPQ